MLGTHRRSVPALRTTAAESLAGAGSVDLGARGVGSWKRGAHELRKSRGGANGGGGAKNAWLTAALSSGGSVGGGNGEPRCSTGEKEGEREALSGS